MSSGEPSAIQRVSGLLLTSVAIHPSAQQVLIMFDTMSAKSRVPELFDDKKWRSIWLLWGAGILLYLALLIMCAWLWFMLRHCHYVT
jgi:hypothetical protein